MTEDPEELVRTAARIGHRVAMHKTYQHQEFVTVLGIDAARWLPEQDRYGHTYHVRSAVTDEMLWLAQNPEDLLRASWLVIIKDAFREVQIWNEVVTALAHGMRR
jgi:hypothetical protein